MGVSARSQPKQETSKPSVNEQMLPKTPRHAVQVLWRENSPDEEVCPQRRACSHDERNTSSDKERQQSEVLAEDMAVPFIILVEQQEVGSGYPEDRASPVADEGKDADNNDVEAADSVVGAGEIDGGDGVGATEGKEGSVLEEDRDGTDFRDGKLGGLQGMKEDVCKEEERDVCCTRLSHAEDGIKQVKEVC